MIYKTSDDRWHTTRVRAKDYMRDNGMGRTLLEGFNVPKKTEDLVKLLNGYLTADWSDVPNFHSKRGGDSAGVTTEILAEVTETLPEDSTTDETYVPPTDDTTEWAPVD